MAVEIEFGSRNAARQIRNDPEYRGFLADPDDARQRTVRYALKELLDTAEN